ncbi:c-type cytochrome [Pyxidicoccus sp. 3LG]
MPLERNWRVLTRALGWSLLALPLVVGCTSEVSASCKENPENCRVEPPVERCDWPAQSGERIPMKLGGRRGVPQKEVFSSLRARVDAQCASCHVAPEARGGFQYRSDLEGLKEAAPRMALLASQGAMPPQASAEQAKDSAELACALNAWLAQGAPGQGAFDVSCETEAPADAVVVKPAVARGMTDLGHCVPNPEDAQKLGTDPEKDAFFAGLTQLPRFLSETDSDIMTFDTLKLARRGTFAFVPTYQLFSDHAKKLRLVHVPAGQAIEYDAANKRFEIPPNTRFYKTFFKEVKDAGDNVTYRRIETRLIVTRERWQDALFGTYIWNEQGTMAELHDLRYRDGSSFSDRVLVYTTDEGRGDTRNYAIPGRHRCINCHTGSEGQNFVLGFTPLELNRRARGEGGLDPAVDILADELSQVDRLIKYGVIKGLTSAAELPRLEDFKSRVTGKGYRNEHELAVQAYFIGNCSQCHNPNGFAVESNPAIADLDFSAGGILPEFPTDRLEVNKLKRYVDLRGNFEAELRSTSPASTLFQRVMRDSDEQYIHMPANVPGKDCRAALLVARWIGSLTRESDTASGLTGAELESARRARIKAADDVMWEICKNPRNVRWVSEDFTDKVPYEPRNLKWKERILPPGPYAHLMDQAITDAHEQLARKLFPTNWWLRKTGCNFEFRRDPPPELDLGSPLDRWTVNELGDPRQPWGTLYYSTPGAVVFQGVCANCHGRLGDGQSGAAKALAAFSGDRVANLVDGLFGYRSDGSRNLDMFTGSGALGDDGAARYLVFMASGGTDVKFTVPFMQAWVKYGEVDVDFSGDGDDWALWGANMLGAARGACDLIRVGRFGTGTSSEPRSNNPNAIGGTRMWTEICSLDNPLTEAVRRGDTVVKEEWLRRAEFNAGVMAYFYLRDHLSRDEPPALLRTECEKRTDTSSASQP